MSLLTALSLSLLTATATAATSAQDSFRPPAELREWQDWVLHDYPDANCPRLEEEIEATQCAWPGSLTIDINTDGASFEQTWQIYGDSWISLPGTQEYWPTEMTLNGETVTALERDGLPTLWLTPGNYRIKGQLYWQQRPQSLQLSAGAALVNVKLDGKAVAWPAIDDEYVLWLQRTDNASAKADKEDRVQATVFRRLSDGVPMTMDTELHLLVSGKPRELRLGRLLLADNIVTHFDSPLPARIETNGSLRIQVRAGDWRVRVASRLTRNKSELVMQKNTSGWPQQEVWSFKPAPSQRGMKITGVEALDPTQLDLPKAWRKLPTYLMEADSTFTLEEQYRGDAAPSANHLELERHVWLDFDGRGATISDSFEGELNQGHRLSVQPNMMLG
ncbi:MAG: hypothetical protein ACR2PJ_01080, partial [Pseudomonadales bacterium]